MKTPFLKPLSLSLTAVSAFALVAGSVSMRAPAEDARTAAVVDSAVSARKLVHLETKDEDPTDPKAKRKKKFFERLGLGAAFDISRQFGNFAGSIKLGKGRLAHDADAYNLLKSVLRPGDVLFEKNAGALTDKLIPGRLGHVALYMGTGKELSALGYVTETKPGLTAADVDAELSKPWLVEALRDDVQINSLSHFMDIDEVYVLRPNYANSDAVRTAIDRALHYLGYEYDFLFDLADDSKIYCTELVTRALSDTPWVLKKRFGISTISVDELFLQAMIQHHFTPIAASYNGAFYGANLGIKSVTVNLVPKLEALFAVNPDGTPIQTTDSQN